MPIVEQGKWEEWVNSNKSAYGKACVDVARRVMEILDGGKEFEPNEIIGRASEEIKTGGITGFMAGCVAQMVSVCHSRGEDFRLQWNKHYGQEGDGVVNPAIITLEV